ncbi:MAG: hypothetical protein IKN71_07115 [Alphaproteobacteria bacterium]|nr:hypothetical protein [Alphaproteobacteria bacterium]
MRFAVLTLICMFLFSACNESEHSEIYNENNTTVVDGVVYNTDEKPINGLYKTYYSNGNVKMEVYSQNGKPNGAGKFYNEKGILQFEGTFADGLRVGTFYHYYNNGNVHNEMHFTDGVLDGIQQTFNKKGELTAEVVYKKGVAIQGYAVVNGEKQDFTAEELAHFE